MKNVKKYINDAIENIEHDRDKASDLLASAMDDIIKNGTSHRDIGLVVAKYLEVLQRSNEQLVKLINIGSKNNKEEDNITSNDIEELYDEIQEEQNKENV